MALSAEDRAEVIALIDLKLAAQPQTSVAITPQDLEVIGAPNEWGAVVYRGASQVKVFDPEWLRNPTKKASLNALQIAGIALNCGTDNNGIIVFSGPALNRVKPGTSIVGLTRKPYKSTRFMFTYYELGDGLGDTVGSRYNSTAEFILAVKSGVLQGSGSAR